MVRLGTHIVALKALELMCNQTLKLDPVAWSQLQHLQGQSLCLHLEGWPLELYLSFSRSGVHFPISSVPSSQTATTQVKGHVKDLLQLVRAEDKQAALAKSDIEIHGRSGLLLQLANMVQHLDLDWASAIQPLIGPVATQALVKGSNELRQNGQKTLDSFKQDVKDYCLNECSITPHAWEVQHFSKSVSQLRARTDRLHARIQRLQRRLSQHSDAQVAPKAGTARSEPKPGQYTPE